MADTSFNAYVREQERDHAMRRELRAARRAIQACRQPPAAVSRARSQGFFYGFCTGWTLAAIVTLIEYGPKWWPF